MFEHSFVMNFYLFFTFSLFHYSVQASALPQQSKAPTPIVSSQPRINVVSLVFQFNKTIAVRSKTDRMRSSMLAQCPAYCIDPMVTGVYRYNHNCGDLIACCQ